MPARFDPAQASHCARDLQICPRTEVIVAPGACPLRRKRIGTATLPFGKIEDGTHRTAASGNAPGPLPAGAAASHSRQRQRVELSGFVAGGQLEVPAVGRSFAVVGFGPDEFGNDEGDLQAPG
ncbi:MAG: hypothetical protein AW08_01774 [Candidatus Accumulibacter adjunctus]|uniref:Uncharacterized protein n=1 Tax=Candidatus Accumulibacter adjunctus TaxID=1454001 RepID=A0A011MDJ0_9PROT|nr:MAG: hypothetical protein AW08_01774 [Candidatus Accumulibacter adjunctus]